MNERSHLGELGARVVSALVLLPPVLAAVWFGGIWFALLVVAAGVLAGWEFGGLIRLDGAHRIVMAAFYGAVGLGIAALGADRRYGDVLLLALAPALVLYAVARVLKLARVAWGAIGFAWIWLGLASALWLRAQPDGRAWVIWLLAVVWVTDIAGYFVGRGLGGPKLAPRISPGKTWSGFIGAVLAAAGAGWGAAALLDLGPGPGCLLLAGGISIVSQLGDLWESALKRRFGAKDSSGLIPGHGGLLDRIDGLLLAIPALALALTYGV